MSRTVNIIVFTGPPGSGKSTAMERFSSLVNNLNGTEFYVLDEYGDHVEPWIKEKKPEGVFVLDSWDYERMCPEVSLSLARQIGDLAKADDKAWFILETARDVGNPNVGYVDGLFSPLREGLENRGIAANFTNIEVNGGTKEELWRRMEERHKEWAENPFDEEGRLKPEPAPAQVLDNYHFGEDGRADPVVATLEQEEVEGLVANLLIDNTNGFEYLESEVARVVKELVDGGVIKTKEGAVVDPEVSGRGLER